jgi:hypothetical protein
MRSDGKIESSGHPDQGGEGISVHLAHHVATVCLDGDLADSQIAANLFVQSAGYDARHYLSLAMTE